MTSDRNPYARPPSEVVVFAHVADEHGADFVPAGSLEGANTPQPVFVYGKRYVQRPYAVEVDPVALPLKDEEGDHPGQPDDPLGCVLFEQGGSAEGAARGVAGGSCVEAVFREVRCVSKGHRVLGGGHSEVGPNCISRAREDATGSPKVGLLLA